MTLSKDIAPLDPALYDDYHKNPQHSFFRDLLYVTLDDQARRDNAFERPSMRGQGTSELMPRDFDLRAARARLRSAQIKRDSQALFDLNTTTGAAMIPTSQLPLELASEFEAAVRARAVVASALNARPIPADTGMTVNVTSLTGGATVAIQSSENSAISNTDPTFGLPSSSIGYGAGYVDVSRQLVDRSAEGAKVDEVIARELGRAAGELIDGQLLNGSGSSGQITGLLGISGIGAITFTQASPTPALVASKIGEAYANVATNYGVGPDLLLWAPRRAAWALSQADTGDSARRVLSLFAGGAVQAPAMPTTLSTNQDAIITLRREATHAFADSRFEVHADAKSGTLEVRFKVVCRAAVVLGNSKCAAKINGTGLTTPTWAT